MMFTTSRYASEDTRELALVLAEKSDDLFISRGKRTIANLVEIARKRGENRISILEEHKGKPFRISFIEVSELGNWKWAGEKAL